MSGSESWPSNESRINVCAVKNMTTVSLNT